MAVTYSWRITPNIYAYITDKDGLEPFVSEIGPVDSAENKSIAAQAKIKYADDSTNGLKKYIADFAKMESKIRETTGLANIDLLSAEMYYDVDSAACATLKGVGIAGIRYIGAITSLDANAGGPNDWNDVVQLLDSGVERGIPGNTDVYGIYMADDDSLTNDNKDDDYQTIPEEIFVIRNGKDGIVDNERLDNVEAQVNSIEENTNDALTEFSSQLNEFENRLNQVKPDLTQDEVDEIRNDLASLKLRVTTLETDINQIKDLLGLNGDVNMNIEEASEKPFYLLGVEENANGEVNKTKLVYKKGIYSESSAVYSQGGFYDMSN